MERHLILAGEKGGGAVLLGTYDPKLDDKGRVILPAKFRDELRRRARA